MAGSDGLTWGVSSATVNIGETITVPIVSGMAPTASGVTAAFNGLATATVGGSEVEITGVAAGTVTVPTDTNVGNMVRTVNAFTLTVVDTEEKFLDKNGLDYYDSLIATEIDGKQDALTAGTGISITNNVISATGGGEADSVAWGHITGSMSSQTDLTTALAAKANSADLATVATSGDYDDLTDKPTIGNATLTIQKNGTSAGTFTANATSNKTINITVPTTAADVSALPASTKYGASIAVSINTTDYKVTTTLKDQDGNTLGTAQVIDLPLESVVVNGSYDSTNKKIVLTLQNGNTIDIPVADLVAGLQSEITSTNKLASDLVDDTNQTHKFMTSAEKTKLSGIAAGAEVNVQSDWDQTTTTADDYIKNKPSLATVATSGSYNDLSNKPTIPTVNNATLTIQKNGSTVKTFTANASSNVTANITVPTKTSDLTNDSGFLDSVAWGDVTGKPTFATVATSGSYNDLSNKPTIPAAQVQSDWAQATTTAVDYIKNKPTKVSDFTNDAGYITSYTDTQVTQTRVDPDTITTFYPVASTSRTTDTGDVKKFSAVKLNYASDDGGVAELELGQNSYYDPVYGALTLWDGGTSQHKTTLRRTTDATDQTFYFPYDANSTGGTLVANGGRSTATGSATNPVYADMYGILHATTYSLNKTVPSDAVFTDTTYSDATTSTAGLMSAADKSKLNSIAAGAEINVQANWAQTTETADDYIRNKPTIPTVNNGTLTIQKNGTNVQTFTANQSTNATANITVPTKTSELTNDSSFVTSSGTVAKADQLTTGRTIAIGTGATGTATSFNGTSNITIPITDVKDAYVTWGGKNIVGNITPDDMGCIDEFGHNKLAFLSADCIEVKYSTDGGSSWIDYGLTDAQKVKMVSTTGTGIYVGGPTDNATSSNIANLKLRVRIAAGPTSGGKIYTAAKKILINMSNQGAAGSKVDIRYRTIANYKAGTETWVNVGTFDLAGGSGWNSIPFNYTFGGSFTSQTSQMGQIEFVLYCSSLGTWGYKKPDFIDFRLIGSTNWAMPSEMARAGHLYTVDEAQNATFPANVSVTGSLKHGNYTYTLPNKNGTVAMTSDIPSVPTVNNGQLTIQKNGTNVQTFTANQSGNATANITVPTKTSDLTNDSNFVASTALATVATSGSYNDLSNKPTIPTVNNATLTIQKNGTTVKTFTANASSNVTANITVPTALSDLSGTVSSSQIADGAVTSGKIDWTTLGHHHTASSTQTTIGTTNTTLLSFQLTAGTWLLIGTSDFNHANTATGDACLGFWNLTANTAIGNAFYFNELNNGTYWSVETAHEVVTLTGTANIGFFAKKGQGTLYSTRKSFTAIRIG